MQDKDCPLMYPDLEPIDHVTQCPKYTAILARSEEDGIGLEELDSVQSDLETLLANAGKRLKQLENEVQILQNWQEKNGNVKESIGKVGKTGKVQPDTPVKRGKGSDEKPVKKFKDSSGKGASASFLNRPKSKITQPKLSDDAPMVDLSKLPKNNAVNKFWASVEPYCADITNEDLKFLEELLRSHEDDSDYFKVPALGMHYTEKWAEEDLLEEQQEGAKIDEKRRGNNGITNTNGATGLLKKAESSIKDESLFGPLTQRLVSALIEENIMTPMDDDMEEGTGNNDTLDIEAPAISPRALAKQLNLGNPAHLEKRIKRELEEQGILDLEDTVDDDPDDEILAELRKKQAELKTVSQHNIMVTKKLYRLAKEMMDRQELKRKLSASDAEVMEAYRKIQIAKQKKKPPTKKERDAVLKALKDREQYVKTLDI